MGRAAGYASLVSLLIAFFAVAVAAAQGTPEQEAIGLQEQAERLLGNGKYNDGIEAARRALALREKALGNEHLDVAASLQTLGVLYLRAGNFDLAQSTHQRALALREKVLGPAHQDTAASLLNLADTYSAVRNFSKAEPLYQRALAIFETVLGAEQVETAKALFALARLYTETAAYDRAEPLFQRALAIQERASGAGSVEAARVLDGLGGMYRNLGDYARAKALFRRASAIHEKVLGPEHPETTSKLANLANLYGDTGDYFEAEALYKRVLAIWERTLGAEHPNTARLLSYLATVYLNTGAYSQAEPPLRRAIAIQEKIQDRGKAGLVVSLINLADMHRKMGRPDQAEPVLRRALQIAEEFFAPTDPLTSAVVANLGDVYRRMEAYDRAEPLLKRVIAMAEATQGPEHTKVADFVYFLAKLYSDSGATSKTRPLYQRAVAIYEKVLGPDHPSTASALRSLAVDHWTRGEKQQALSLLQRVQRIEAKNSERFLLAGSETRKQDYLQTRTEGTFVDISFAMSTPGTAATVLGIGSVLQHKGRVLDAVSDNLARIRRSVAPTNQALLEQLADVAAQLSSLIYRQGGNLSPEQYRGRLAQLTAQQGQLEADLASRSGAFRREVTPVTLGNVTAAIPVNATLVEWFRYTPFDPTQKNLKARRGPPRYVAYVLKRKAEPVAVDIGEAQAVDALVRRVRAALADPASSDVKLHAAALSEKLLTPLRVHLRGVDHILFSPDGELNLVPMAALLDESGAYLAERFDVSYLTSGRDLLRIAAEPTTRAEAVVMADPDYGKRGVALARNTPAIQPQRSLDLDRSGLTFRPLASTALEAQDLKALLKLDDASVLLRLDASEAKLKRLKGPRILHIASHGFFLSDQQLTEEMTKRRGSDAAPLVASENPLLRSGIALAGANERTSGDDDGILTALEATQLDLAGTELVVLSACDSGVGEIQNGEGVYGLRRALALAGAQTQITSLWKVSDVATRSLMVDYYRRLLQGEGRAAALRQVQRAMLTSPTFSHPYYWASFIPIGNWAPLPPLLGQSGGN